MKKPLLSLCQSHQGLAGPGLCLREWFPLGIARDSQLAVAELAAALVLAVGTGLGGNGGLLAMPEHSHSSCSVLVPLRAVGTNQGAAFHCLPFSPIDSTASVLPRGKNGFVPDISKTIPRGPEEATGIIGRCSKGWSTCAKGKGCKSWGCAAWRRCQGDLRAPSNA